MKTEIWPEAMAGPGPSGDEVVESLMVKLDRLRADIRINPELNPTALLAHTLSVRFESGDLGLDDLRGLAGTLIERAFSRRAMHLRRYLGIGGEADDPERLAVVAARWIDEAPEDFSVTRALLARPKVGAVFTAHPTFGMSAEASLIMADIATGGRDETALEMVRERLKDIGHAPDGDISLSEEHIRAQQAVIRLKGALADFNRALIAAARERWPDDWRNLNPQPMTVASWVGYDLDGRTDIGWQQMIGLKLSEKRDQLHRYRARLEAVRAMEDADDIATGLDAAVARIVMALDHTERCQALFSGDLSSIVAVAEAANALSDVNGSGRLVNGSEISAMLGEMIAGCAADSVAMALMVLRAEIDLVGLGTAHIHLRINAVQLQNGINQLIRPADTEGNAGRLQTSRLNRMIAEAEPRSVNTRSLMQEQSTAIRQFILMAQIVKHVDAETPIRFLIAECEHPFTVLTAIYFARLFDIDDRIDISPLFETPIALESGARMMEQLLENDRYMAYVRGRGRIAIQTGFSDAGRFIGQIPATLGIERLQIKLARLLGARGIEGLEVVVFDTHGESLGRGAHPGSLRERLVYVLSAVARRQFARAGVALKHETSFQGGDGYLLFANDQMARYAAGALLEDALTVDGDHTEHVRQASRTERDPLYRDTDFTLDFFLRLAGYHQRLFADPDYRVALGAFGTNLLYKTGSRKSIRQHDAMSAVDRGNPAQMRAIPHNAILQQLGYLANVAAGIGTAVGDERDRFVSLCENSERARCLFSMVATAIQHSSLNTLGAYAGIFDGGYWISRAYNGNEASLGRPLSRLSQRLGEDPRHRGMMRLVHRLRRDAIDLHAILDRLGLDGGKVPTATRLELDMLHAVRIALIKHIFIMAARIPLFANRNDVSPEQVMDLVLNLEIPSAVAILRDVFPDTVNEPGDVMFLEEASYASSVAGGYHDLHEKLFDPMLQAFRLVREISIGVSHHFRAHG